MYSAAEFVSLVKKLWIGKPKQCSYHRFPGPGQGADTKAVLARRGYVAIYVGKETKRFEIPIKYLSSVAFQEQLTPSQRHDHDPDVKIDGPIRLGCTSESFKLVLEHAKRHFI